MRHTHLNKVAFYHDNNEAGKITSYLMRQRLTKHATISKEYKTLMNKTMILFIGLVLIMFLPACGGTTVEATPTTTPPDSTALPQPDIAPRATVTPMDNGYPAAPVPTPYPEGYAGPDLTVSPLNSYPGKEGLVWMIHAAGEQCNDELTYADLDTAVAALDQAGIVVADQASAEITVCETCGCPTSLHFLVQINEGDVAAAEGLGWERDK